VTLTRVWSWARPSMDVRQMKTAQRPKITMPDCVLRACLSTIPPLPKLTHPIVTGMFNRPLQFRSPGFSRWLGLLLIAFIFYGTTVEAAHRHGRVLSDNGDLSAVTRSEESGNPAGTPTGCGDCLICQLHQNFNTTLIALRLNDPPAQVLYTTTTIVAPDLLSSIISPVAGRAPPSIS
jgi:hypothetical protein